MALKTRRSPDQVKFHVNPETGRVGLCEAVIKCKFNLSDGEHFLTEEDARAAFEMKNADRTAVTTAAEDVSLFRREDGSGIFTEKRDPMIYAFTSSMFNEANDFYAVKVGDTSRSVNERMDEWRKQGVIYEQLEVLYTRVASFLDSDGNKVYFRDYNLHKRLQEKGWHKVVDYGNKENGGKYDWCGQGKISHEFYINPENTKEGVSEELVDEAINHQREMYGVPGSGYEYYTNLSGQKADTYYLPTSTFKPRAFQQAIVDDASDYLLDPNNPARHYLLSAPTRAGKTFTAIHTVKKIFEASKKDNNICVVLSGFAEVEDEWKRSVQSHVDFNQKEYSQDPSKNKCGTSPCTCKSTFVYLNKADLTRDPNAIQKAIDNGAENVIVFLTLQDLAGSTAGTKDQRAHDFLREVGNVDMVLSDEAHFAMFTENGSYQKVLNGSLEGDISERVDAELLSEEAERQVSKRLRALQPTFGKLFITATPYNVLLQERWFDLKRNVSIVTEADIQRERREWDAANLPMGPDVYTPEKYGEMSGPKPWHNPCYGIPTKKHFAVDLGTKPNELFAPVDNHDASKGFLHRDEVRSVIAGMFGTDSRSKCPPILGDEDFKAAGLGNHVYLTLPLCASCDAMEVEMKRYLKKTGLDSQYEILNISSTNPNHPISKLSSTLINRKIDQAAKDGKKTITITVDRMGTGVTQEKWDTVIIARSMKSAQKFVQTSGRPGTPWVSTQSNAAHIPDGMCHRCQTRPIRDEGKWLCATCYSKPDGGEAGERKAAPSEFKIVEKPNSAVISFEADQMVQVTYSLSRDMAGNRGNGPLGGEDVEDELREALAETELFIYDAEKNKMEQVTATNILDKVLSSMRSPGTQEMASRIPVNLDGVLEDAELTSQIIDSVNITNSKDSNLNINAWNTSLKADGICLAPDCDREVRSGLSVAGNPFRLCKHHWDERERRDLAMRKARAALNQNGDSDDLEPQREGESKAERDLKDLKDRIRTVYAATLLYVALTENREPGLGSLINTLRQSPRDAEVARHLGLDINLLEGLHRNHVGGIDFDNAIAVMNGSLKGSEDAVTPEQKWTRFDLILRSYERFSPTEVPTPQPVSSRLVDSIKMTDQDWDKLAQPNSGGVIDIGAKSAVNLVEVYKRGLNAGLTHEQMRGKMVSVPTSSTTYELVRKVYETFDWDDRNIIFIEGSSALNTSRIMELAVEQRGCRSKDPRKCFYHGNPDLTQEKFRLAREKFIGKVDPAYRAQAEQRMEQWKNMDRFDVVVSNPPYNTPTSNGQLYTAFYALGQTLGQRVAMVFPTGWQRNVSGGGKSGFYKRMRDDRQVVSIDNYDELRDGNVQLFPTVRTGGVNLINWEYGSDNGGMVDYSEYGKPIGKKTMSRDTHTEMKDTAIFNKVGTSGIGSDKSAIENSIIGGRLKSWVTTRRDRREAQLGKEALSMEPKEGWVKVWARKEGPLKYDWHYIDPAVIPNEAKQIESQLSNKYTVVFPHTGAYRLWRYTRIHKPGEAFSESFRGRAFDTEEEAKNFQSYMSTIFYRYMITTAAHDHNASARIHREVPDLVNVRNPRTGKIGYQSDWTDEDMIKLFRGKLTKSDWIHMAETAIGADKGQGAEAWNELMSRAKRKATNS